MSERLIRQIQEEEISEFISWNSKQKKKRGKIILKYSGSCSIRVCISVDVTGILDMKNQFFVIAYVPFVQLRDCNVSLINKFRHTNL